MSTSKGPEVSKFTISVPDEALEDLRDRLRRTRFPDDFGNDDWRYGYNARVTAVQNITLEIRRHEVVGLIGENGAGKSSLLKILTGIYQPDSGTIESHGKVVKFRRPRDPTARSTTRSPTCTCRSAASSWACSATRFPDSTSSPSGPSCTICTPRRSP